MHVYTPALDDCTSDMIRTRPDCSVIADRVTLSFCHDTLGTGLCEKPEQVCMYTRLFTAYYYCGLSKTMRLCACGCVHVCTVLVLLSNHKALQSNSCANDCCDILRLHYKSVS